MVTEFLSSVPVPGLDGISRADLEREFRGAIAIARLRVETLTKMERPDPKAIRGARRHLVELLLDARAEKVRPFWYER